MGYRDGAVSGMASRLMPLGFMPEEAQCLGQAAYLPTERIAPNYPKPLRPRPEVSHLINLAIKGLSQNPFGPRAHLGRIVLWESVFGEDSWHEEIEFTTEDREYMEVFQEALLGDLAPLPAGAGPQTVRHAPVTFVASPAPTTRAVPAPVVQQAPLKSAPQRPVLPTASAAQPVLHSKGRSLYIFVGVCAILLSGIHVIELVSLMLRLDPDSTSDARLGGLLLIPGAFGMLSIGGAAASGINTRSSKIMMLAASSFTILAYIVFISTGYASVSTGSVLIGITAVIAICTAVSLAQGRTNSAI